MRSMTSSNNLPWLQPVVDAFQLGEPQRLTRLQTGQIQQTWQLETNSAAYICQSLHPAFDKAVTEDAEAVSCYLSNQGFGIPRFMRTRQGDLHLDWQEQSWRVMNCLPGRSHRRAPSAAYLQHAGRAAGHLHRLLCDFDHDFQFQLPNFHASEQIWQQLFAHPSDPHVEFEWLFLIEQIPALLLPADLPRQIIHGDLKLTNFLFDEAGAVVGIVDLDTFMYHNLYVELGDALRSWCTAGEHFDLMALQASLEGYAEAGALHALDPGCLIAAIKLITLELAMRYLIDYFEDCYFQWDPAAYGSRCAHNLARCRRQIAVYRDLVRQHNELEQIVAAVFISEPRVVEVAV